MNDKWTALVSDLYRRAMLAIAQAFVALCERLGFDATVIAERIPPDSVVVICPCGQKNRVRPVDFNRGPICGKCRRMLRLPS